ncbi:MAG TPA: hypothetical protein VME43_21250 [Bryobacteraceae bacterium]|nr:hypothetical protein [Bryobacteraceae bacterium]
MNAMLLLAAAFTAMAALAQQPAQTAPREAIARYAIYLDDSMFGNWNYALDPMDPAAMHAAYGHEYAWFRQGANRYVVTDPAVLNELRAAVEPQNEVNHMKDVRTAEESDLRMRQMMAATIARVQEMMQQRHMAVANTEFQQTILAAQERVNQEQQKIDAEQRVAADSTSRIPAILDSAVRRHLAKRLP